MQRPIQLAPDGASASSFRLCTLTPLDALSSPRAGAEFYPREQPSAGIFTRSLRTGLAVLPRLPFPRRPISPDSGLGRRREFHPPAPVVAAPAPLRACGFSVGWSADWRSADLTGVGSPGFLANFQRASERQAMPAAALSFVSQARLNRSDHLIRCAQSAAC